MSAPNLARAIPAPPAGIPAQAGPNASGPIPCQRPGAVQAARHGNRARPRHADVSSRIGGTHCGSRPAALRILGEAMG